MKLTAPKRSLSKIQFLSDENGGIVQTIPLDNERCLIVAVNGFKEFEYSFEGPVPFSGDPRLAFNKRVLEPEESHTTGFKLIGKEFNRIARLSGTNDPEIINTFRTRLNKHGEIITFHISGYCEDGHIMPLHSLDSLNRSEEVPPDDVCLATIEVRCERSFDYIPSRSTYFLLYYPGKIRVVSHIVHGGPPLDCPGEEWEAKAYEGPLESGIYKFFAHNDGAILIELQTQPRGLLHAALGKLSLEHVVFSQTTLKFSPVMVRNTDARYAFSPPEIPEKGNTNHLNEFKKCLEVLQRTILRAIGSNSDASGSQLE